MSIFILGPSRTDDGDETPLNVRKRIAARAEASDVHAIVMESEPGRDDENNFQKFSRLKDSNDPITYMVVVPLNARLHGLSVELGHLLTELEAERLDARRIHLCLQRGVATLDDEEGELALNESGNRTRYYDDLLDYGCPFHQWLDEAELDRVAQAIAIEDTHGF